MSRGSGRLDWFFHIPSVTILELNPATYKHLLLGQGDPEAAHYQPWLKGDETTKVSIINKEARHFCSMQPEHSYDLIQASGVDTLTAVASGALVNSDNYLYTIDAVRSYARLLKPGGLLSLTHWRFQPPQLGLKMFVTYLQYLDETGNKTPWRNLVCVGNEWQDTILKTTPFTESELNRLRQWCKRTGNLMVFDPSVPMKNSSVNSGTSFSSMSESDIYRSLAFAPPDQRKQLLDTYLFDMSPATDDKPYFYQIARSQSIVGSFRWVSETTLCVYVTLVMALILSFLPMLKSRSLKLSGKNASYLAFFALSGFAFLLFEVAIIQMFSIFVGGPTYALAVVLVAVLSGYSTGCFIANYIPIRSSSFLIAGASLCISLLLAYLSLPHILSALMPLSFESRIVVCAILTFAASVLTGIPVSLGMETVKRADFHVVPWMWGVSSGFNGLGSASFVFLAQKIGISETLIVSAVLYLIANVVFAFQGAVERKTG